MSGLRNFSSGLTVAMFAIFASFVLVAASYPPEARFMPWVVGIPGALLCLVQLVIDWRGGSVKAVRDAQPAPPVELPSGAAVPEPEAEGPTGAALVRRELVIWAYFVGFIAGLLLFGFWVAIPVLIVAFLRFEAGTSWLAAVASSIVATAVLYGAFEVFLGIRLHHGFLTPGLLGLLGM